MSNKCQMVVFSNRAYNAIIRESFDKDPVETGGILLGHILDNGVWIVMEVLPPGIKCIFERAYFEYDDAFVNYLAQSVANQYNISLDLLGLWHRHPGSMDVFSSTDDGTNTTFALQNPNGVISGLVNIDPQFRLTMYHMENPRNVTNQYDRPTYEQIDIEVGDDIIPEEYFRLKYFNGEGSNPHPFVECSHTKLSRSVRTKGIGHRTTYYVVSDTTQDNYDRANANYEGIPLWLNDLIKLWNILKRNRIMSLIALILIILSIFSFKIAIDRCRSGIETVISWFSDKREPHISKDENAIRFEDENTQIDDDENKTEELETDTIDKDPSDSYDIVAAKSPDNDVIIKIKSWRDTGKREILLTNNNYLVPTDKPFNVDNSLITFSSENTKIATITNGGRVTPIAIGTTKIIVSYKGKEQDSLLLTIKEK